MDSFGQIRPVNINEEMRGSYLDYAMSVIVARALPDARDGLKPVHRRILYAMHDMGMRANTQYRKSARIVGDVLGKYHPHGDSAVYEAMARMAQDFSLRYPLVDGQGNFGSVDGDSPAAMRYTEARLARLAEELLADLDADTVDFVDNYDGTTQEPMVLPARLPNMLLNGATGIAVGMATSIPPHNLRELAAAISYLIDNYERQEDISVDELMQFVKGPDFPTGAEIVVADGMTEAYGTGLGRVVVRGKYEVETSRTGRLRLVFTEIPYMVTKTAIVERIVALSKEKKLPLVTDLRDESDRRGMRLVVELAPGAQASRVANQLFKHTQLQSTFSIQMLALVNGEPRTLSLRRMLQIYVQHRIDVIERRSRFELGKRRARAHILEGLLKALSSLDAIIQTIRTSDDAESARSALMNDFFLSEAQSNAILEMQLRRLAALEQQRLLDEFNEVMARIAWLEDLLASPEKVLALIREDVNDLAEKYGDDRRTSTVYGVNTTINEDDLVTREEVVILLTEQSYIKRVPSAAYRTQRRGGKGVIGMGMREEDAIVQIVAADSHDVLLFFTDRGKVYSLDRAYQVPEAGRASRGTRAESIIELAENERITAIVPVESFDMDGYFVLTTRKGRIKRVRLEEFSGVRRSGVIAMALEDDDRLNWANYTDGDQDVLVVSEGGQSIRFHERNVRVMGRTAAGVRAMRLHEGDLIAGMDVVRADHTHMLVITANGYGKQTPLENYGAQGRFGLGRRTLVRDERTGPIVAMRCVNSQDGILLLTRDGIVLRTELEQIRATGRIALGVRTMDLDEGAKIAGIAIIGGALPEPETSSTVVSDDDEGDAGAASDEAADVG